MKSFDYILQAVPLASDRKLISSLIDQEELNADPVMAYANALIKWGKADIADYLERYGDVKERDLDPLIHFITKGIKAGRFLRYKDSSHAIGTLAAKDILPPKPSFDEDKNSFILENMALPYGRVINIAYITDRDYLLPTLVSIYSLYEHRSHTTSYHVHIIIHRAVDLMTINKIKNLENLYFKISIIPVPNMLSELLLAHKNGVYVSTTALIKFYLADILPTVDKLLYIDSDTIIQDNLEGIYSIDLADRYVAAAIDIWVTFVSGYGLKEFGMERGYYFNSGVMLLNTKKLREEYISEKLLFFKRQVKKWFMDQDAFNNVLGQNMRFLNIKYNLIFNIWAHKVFTEYMSTIGDFPVNSTPEEIIKHAAILHFAGGNKPWHTDPPRYPLGQMAKTMWDGYKNPLEAFLATK